MSIKEANDLSFEDTVLSADRPVLVDFGARWCEPCRRLELLLEALAEKRPDVDFVRVDVDASPATAATYGVRGVPTLVLFHEGKAAGRMLGLSSPKSIEALLPS